MMDSATADLVLQTRGIQTLDLTGGAPELNPHFRRLVAAAQALGVQVPDRCNLTILSEPGHQDLAEFLASSGVEIVASMPCYAVENVDRQRGEGVIDRSISGLQALNRQGYAMPGTGLMLNLVYNPQGPSLPPPQAALQAALQADYKRELPQHFGVHFNRLFALANMPIQRFGSTLVSNGKFASCMRLLKGAHQVGNPAAVMRNSMLSVDYQGDLHDCDFNQMLGLPARLNGRTKPHCVTCWQTARWAKNPHRQGTVTAARRVRAAVAVVHWTLRQGGPAQAPTTAGLQVAKPTHFQPRQTA